MKLSCANLFFKGQLMTVSIAQKRAQDTIFSKIL